MRRVKLPAPSARRRRSRPAGGRRLGLRLAALLVLAGAAAGGGWWAWHSGAVERSAQRALEKGIELTLRAGLRVEEVYVEGRARTPRDHLQAALQIERGDPILGFDLEGTRRRLEGLPWVSKATVERRLPGVIHVTIEERRPIALWQHDGRFTLVDRDGVTIADDITPFRHLPQLIGAAAPAQAAALTALLAEQPDLRPRVKAATLVSGRRWNLRLDDLENGVDVRLPEEQAATAWRRLAELEREHGLMKRKVAMIDLRLPDRLVIRLTDGTPLPLPAIGGRPGKDA